MNILREKSTALAAAWMINSIAYSIVYPFLPIYFHQGRGLPMTQVGLIFPIMGAAMIAGPYFAGALADRFGRSLLMRIGQGGRAFLFFVLTAMVYFEAPFWSFAVMLFINTMVGALFQIGADAYLTDHTTVETRAKAYGKIRIGTNIGWALGPMTGAFLSDFPFEVIFLSTAVLCIAGERYTSKFCPEAKKISPVVHTSRPIHAGGRSPLWHDAFTLTVLAASFALFALASQLYSILSVYSTDTVGISRRALGFVYSLNGAVVIFFQIPVIRLLDRMKTDSLRRLTIGSLFYAAGFFFLGFVSDTAGIMLCVFILTLGEVITQPALYTIISHVAPANYVGRYLAILSLVRGVAYSIGPYVGSLAFAAFAGSRIILWGVLALFGAAAAFGYWRLGHSSQSVRI